MRLFALRVMAAWIVRGWEFEARGELREAEAPRLLALADTDRTNTLRLKSRLQAFFTDQGITKLETDRFRMSVHMNGSKAPLIVPEEWSVNRRARLKPFISTLSSSTKKRFAVRWKQAMKCRAARSPSAAHIHGLSKKK